MTDSAQTDLTLTFVEMTEADIPALTAVMQRAFDDDAQRHLGQPRGGPDGYDTGDFFRQWVFGYRESRGDKVMHADEVVGGCVVWVLSQGNNVLGTVFVDPAFQRGGIGAAIWRYIEETFPANPGR